LLAALPDLDGQHIGVAQERDSINPLRDGLYNLEHPDTIDSTVLANIDMIVQRKGLMSRRSQHFGKLTLRLNGHRMTAGHHAYAGRPVPQPPQPSRLMLRETKRLYEERESGTAEQAPGEGTRNCVFQLMRTDLSIRWASRHRPKMPGDYLGDGELVDRATPLA
jgi:hypothetical protein